MARPSEDELIARHLAPLAGSGSLGLKDDAALFAPSPGHELVLTVDAIVEGVHFLPDDPAETVAAKALGVNLSDLAAKGARPSGFLLVLALPDGWTEEWLVAFCRGLGVASSRHHCPLLGGDTVRAAGPLTVSVTALGEVPAGRMVRRTTARPGDLIAVSGTIGDAVVGLALLGQAPLAWEAALSPDEAAELTDRYRVPRPRLALAEALRDLAHAAMDVSDGLVGDAAKLLRASGVSGFIDLDVVPFSRAARAALEGAAEWRDRLVTGGDDYEVLFTLPESALPQMRARAEAAGVPIAVIGRVEAGGEPPRFTREGKGVALGEASFAHFR